MLTFKAEKYKTEFQKNGKKNIIWGSYNLYITTEIISEPKENLRINEKR